MPGKLFCSTKSGIVKSTTKWQNLCWKSYQKQKNTPLSIWPICPIGKNISEKASVVRVKKEVLGRLNGDQNDDIVSRNNKFRAVGREEVLPPKISTDQLSLFQPGADYAHQILIAPFTGFSDLPTALHNNFSKLQMVQRWQKATKNCYAGHENVFSHQSSCRKPYYMSMTCKYPNEIFTLPCLDALRT